jgi:N utilization substance protein B
MNRKQARENAFILLFEAISKSDESAAEIYEKATSVRELEENDYVKEVFFGSLENYKIIDEYVEKALVGWKKERISIASRAILTLASYEMMFLSDVPVKVAINEGIELSKKFDDEKAYALVNGALNKIAELLSKK